MKKIFSLFAALTLSVGLWAETVSYRYPTYVDDDVTKGIDMWQTSSKEAAPISSSSSTWGAAGQETWFVVSENVTISQRVTCQGDVHLILANDVTLNATQGITVSGEGNSLTIYAQTEDIARMGRLIADATSTWEAAGIGGDYGESGSYITINGGIVTATGGTQYDGAGAGIGGGADGSGFNITILAGKVTATGGDWAAGIGGGRAGSASDIFVATDLIVKADGNNPPTTVITNTGADLASSLSGKQYATIKDPLPDIKTAAIAAVNAEIAESDNDNVKAIATDAATAINAATTVAEVNALKTLAIAAITSAKAAYGEGYDAGEAAVRAALPTEGTTGPAITITKGDKTVTFYNTEKVEYSIVDAD